MISLGEGDSKKSLSLVLSEDLEGQRTANDGSESPLMRKKETRYFQNFLKFNLIENQ